PLSLTAALPIGDQRLAERGCTRQGGRSGRSTGPIPQAKGLAGALPVAVEHKVLREEDAKGVSEEERRWGDRREALERVPSSKERRRKTELRCTTP
ncbi:MAG: hypothetical protein AN485_22145, partial [Anabaena sp. MDT14b]